MDLNRVRAGIEMPDGIAARVRERDGECVVVADGSHENRIVGVRGRRRKHHAGETDGEHGETSKHPGTPFSDGDAFPTVAAFGRISRTMRGATSRPPLCGSRCVWQLVDRQATFAVLTVTTGMVVCARLLGGSDAGASGRR